MNFVTNRSLMVLRTREKLIEVARQLFANKGVENTTMSDIANASENGRRTLYTYFKNKREIYEATIERDSEHLVEKLRLAVAEAQGNVEKLEAFMRYRIEMFELKPQFSTGPRLNSLLYFDFKRIERLRKLVNNKENEILREIINNGINDGTFDPEQSKLAVPAINFLLQGIDLTLARNNVELIDMKSDFSKSDIIKYTINSLINHKTNQK